jgi:hypothetical protein
MRNYVRTHQTLYMALPPLPKTVEGHVRRYKALSSELDRVPNPKRQATLKIVRSWTLIQAEQLGAARFRQLCRQLGFTMRSPQLGWHRLLAQNAVKLLKIVEWLPTTDQALRQLARLDSEQLHDLILRRKLEPSLTSSMIKELTKRINEQ